MTLRQVSIKEIIPKTIQIKMVETDHVDGNVSEREIGIISKIVAYQKPKSIFEFGTFDGRTTINMAINSPLDTRIYTLDLPASQKDSTKYPLTTHGQYSDLTYVNKPESGSRYKGREGSEKIIQLYGDSALFDYSTYKGGMDLIFVDGSHARKYTENDTEVALSMLKPGGIIIWHDYARVWPDVTAVLNEYNSKGLNVEHIVGTTLAVLRT
jgi:predicted O-methyltransferase YrrM